MNHAMRVSGIPKTSDRSQICQSSASGARHKLVLACVKKCDVFETRSQAQRRYRFFPAVAPAFFFVLKGAFGAAAALLGSSLFSAGGGAAVSGAFGARLCSENLSASTLIVLSL